jgi:hypothetical protein
MRKITRRELVGASTGLPLMGILTRAQAQQSKRIYIVQSYEQGHVCGEPQAEGIC